MASQPSPNNSPAAEQLWQAFVTHTKQVNAHRYIEDASDTRVHGSAFVHQSSRDWDEELAVKHMKRSNEDMEIAKKLFDEAFALGRKDALESIGLRGNGHLMSDSASGIAGSINFNPPHERDIDGHHGDASYMARIGGEYSVARGPETAMDQDAGPVQAPIAADENLAPATRPTQFTLSEVPVTTQLVAWPKRSFNFYVMLCPGCDRVFERKRLPLLTSGDFIKNWANVERWQSAHSMFAHLAQSDGGHVPLFAGNRSFKGAVAVAGIRLVPEEGEQGIDLAAVQAHNERAIKKNRMVN